VKSVQNGNHGDRNPNSDHFDIRRSMTMSKARDTRKDVKKKPAKTAKEKRKEKREKKKKQNF